MNRNSANCSSYFDAREEDGEIRALGEITEVLSTIPPDVHFGFSVVTSGNHAYVIGGKIGRGRNYRSTSHVFRFDFKHAERGWEQVTSMRYRWSLPEALAAQGSPNSAGCSKASYTRNCFEYLILRMWRNRHGGIYAAGEGGYRTSASF
ncbi:hypothetical protein GOBAR_AA12210 [Gossypium barbadense]|uniref:Uncharacterized protein n=1 Tax=Gossypium barbadense TaxID=3634 RepID=A0A2P5XYK4_GOSBA|nr:hypothetical protein GOBAR_AA12210 [Gossypium barbadense]